MTGPDDQVHLRLGTAALFAVLAKALGECDKAFLPSFDRHLQARYNQLHDSPLSSMQVLEMLAWTREMIRGDQSKADDDQV